MPCSGPVFFPAECATLKDRVTLAAQFSRRVQQLLSEVGRHTLRAERPSPALLPRVPVFVASLVNHVGRLPRDSLDAQ